MNSILFTRQLFGANNPLGFGNGYATALGNGVANINFLSGFDTMGADQLTVFVSDNGDGAAVALRFRVKWSCNGQDPNNLFSPTGNLDANRANEVALQAGAPVGGVQTFTANIMEWAFAVTPGTRTGFLLYFPICQQFFHLGCYAVGAPPGTQAVDIAYVLGRGPSSTNVPNG